MDITRQEKWNTSRIVFLKINLEYAGKLKSYDLFFDSYVVGDIILLLYMLL